ncbi:unnamed protein product [Hermetia illucens]|uniref:Uncharacterized protein n=2 Tax=Hermetia illucens TaxID=343691 RepID=A0A7R8Z521_HERIL|nr:unnamed protein product [Hermetia illucens]
MSAGTGRDVREYVTKRTCVSLILTIAFFTLISGFLLGKFVADRQYHIKYFRDTDLHMLKDLILARNTLDSSVEDIIRHSNTSVHNELNIEIYSQYTHCMKDPIEYKMPLDVFVARYISHKISQQGTCFLKLGEFVRSSYDKERQQQQLP